MLYVLMACAFMSSSGETCTDIKSYPTADLCELERKKHPDDGFETYKCEARKWP